MTFLKFLVFADVATTDWIEQTRACSDVHLEVEVSVAGATVTMCVWMVVEFTTAWTEDCVSSFFMQHTWSAALVAEMGGHVFRR